MINQLTPIIVTGAAGLLGSHSCERLHGKGADVLSVDDYFNWLWLNIKHLLAHSRFEAMRHDITFPLYLEAD